MHIEVSEVSYRKLRNDKKIETSEEIRERVNKARNIQIERYKNNNIFSNSELTPKLIKKYCSLEKANTKLLEMSFKELGLSARAYSIVLKLARTIADLENSEHIKTEHLAEAVQYRNLDRKYWGDISNEDY